MPAKKQSEEIFDRFDRNEITDEELDQSIQQLKSSNPAWKELETVSEKLQTLRTNFFEFDAFAAYQQTPREKEARGVQARQSMTAAQRAATPFMENWASFSLSTSAIGDLEKLIAQKLTEGPAERAQILQTLRNRLAGVLQRQEDIANGVHPLLKRGSMDPVQANRLRQREMVLNDPHFTAYRDHPVSYLTERAHLRNELKTYTKENLLTFAGDPVVKDHAAAA